MCPCRVKGDITQKVRVGSPAHLEDFVVDNKNLHINSVVPISFNHSLNRSPVSGLGLNPDVGTHPKPAQLAPP